MSTSKTDSEYVGAAKMMYGDEGSIEVDDDAPVSRCEKGAYVQAWVFVYDSDVDELRRPVKPVAACH